MMSDYIFLDGKKYRIEKRLTICKKLGGITCEEETEVYKKGEEIE